MGRGLDRVDQLGDVGGGAAVLRGLARDVHLDEHGECAGCARVDLRRQGGGVQRLDRVHAGQRVVDLVGLQRPDQVDTRAGHLANRVHRRSRLLHAVMAEQDGQARVAQGSGGGPALLGRARLDRQLQMHRIRAPARGRRAVDAVAGSGNGLGNAHTLMVDGQALSGVNQGRLRGI